MGESKVTIPHHYLFGTQRPNEYTTDSLMRVNRDLKNHGEAYLQECPIQVVPLTIETGLILAITEGHTRARLAPKYSIYNIPALIATLEEVAAQENLSPRKMKLKIESGVNETLHTFDQKMSTSGKRMPSPAPLHISQQEFLSFVRGELSSPAIALLGISRLTD